MRKQKALIEAQRARDAAEREALKAEEAAKAKSAGIVGVPGPAGRGTVRGQKRGREGEGVRRNHRGASLSEVLPRRSSSVRVLLADGLRDA